MAPKVLAKNEGAKGVLPVNAATRAAVAKGPAPRLKLEVRRLPPGLTLSEFEEILGEDWKLGNGKVDWREYRQGKVTQSLGKVPEQSRCYVHLINEAAIAAFEARFLAVTFQDKAGTYKNPDIKHLPPTLGFAPNQRTTISTKLRTDNRQGTIDQDPEFIAFLEAETQPIARPNALDSATVDTEKVEKTVVKSTPLIEALREKKAHKAKAAETKAESLKKDSKGNARAEGKNDAPAEKTAKEGKNQQQQQKLDQASKDAVKAVNKQVASKQQQAQQRPASPQQTQQLQKGNVQVKGKKGAQPAQTQIAKAQNATPAKSVANAPASAAAASAQQSPASQTPPKAPRQRGNADGIKKMLQKDLAGIRSKALPAANRAASSSTPSTPTAPAQKETPTKPAPTPPTAPKAQSQPRQQQQQQHQPAPVVSTTKAYLKHANPSQGMTEILIQQALSQFGDVTNVTIDPRKGTAIALFKDPEGLKKAFAAKKVPVANGSVEILEWKDRAMNNSGGNRGGFRGGRGGGARGGRGGGNAASQAPAAAAQAPKGGAGS
ncbi:Putative nonsense-mediated mRNA decay protein [Septoria linicola]|uniref:Nonsense-mediated mRNA decay protein n=1 Tax=Septoria linicola TaxID=215465 RepID=A0A9Q9B300_9PEZI|nr:Putative nonsense-mediated mRNA decay protein [Septoria linicola]